jgi:hypothetical protein
MPECQERECCFLLLLHLLLRQQALLERFLWHWEYLPQQLSIRIHS